MRDAEYERGRIIAVDEVTLGTELVEAAVAGATTLVVDDVVDFDEDGGVLLLNGTQYAYEVVDDDAGTITLTDPLEADADAPDAVEVFDSLRHMVSTEKICEVELDSDDGNVDTVQATLAHYLAADVPEGIRPSGQGESVLLELDGDELRICDVLGISKTGSTGTLFMQDLHTVTAAGAQTFDLTHEPIVNSEHLYWGGLYQSASEWMRDGRTVTVADPTGALKIGDELVVEYAYQVGLTESRFIASSEASGSGTSVTISPPEGVRAGDVLFLASARMDVSTPPGWQLLDAVLSDSQIGGPLTSAVLRVFTKVADVTEQPVTIEGGQSDDVRAAVMVAYRGVTVRGASVGKLDPASVVEYAPPSAPGQNRLVLALYDGDGYGGSGHEVIAVAGGLTEKHNVNGNGGQWSMVAAEGKTGYLRDANGVEAGAHFWLAVSIGYDH